MVVLGNLKGLVISALNLAKNIHGYALLDLLPSAEMCTISMCCLHSECVLSASRTSVYKNAENMSSAHYNFLTPKSNTFQTNNAHLHSVLR